MKTSKKYTLDYFRRIDGLISTSVDDCRISIALENDISFLQDLRSQVCSEGGGKTRLKVIDARIAQIKKGRVGDEQ